jgi:hypothetical protein
MPHCIAHFLQRVYVILTGNILRSPMVLFSQGWSSSTVTYVFPAILALKVKTFSRGRLKFHLQGNNKDNIFEVTGSCPDDEEAAHVLMIVRTFLQKSNRT